MTNYLDLNKAWRADIDINREQVKKCITSQFPDLLPLKSIRLLDEGWDNRVFLVNECIIFRFPRRKIAVELLECENKLLPQLQHRFVLQIPNPIYQGVPCALYPYPFQGYYPLKGISAEHVTEKVCNNSIERLGLFLKQLHSIDESTAISLGAQVQLFDRTEIDKALRTFTDRLNQVLDVGRYPIDMQSIQQHLAQIQTIKLSSSRCLVHGDLHFKHLLFDQERLTGVIDWGDCGINHPVIDLSIVWLLYPKQYHEYFLAIYGFVDEISWCYARFLGLYSAVTFLLYGHDIGNKALVKAAVAAIERINAS